MPHPDIVRPLYINLIICYLNKKTFLWQLLIYRIGQVGISDAGVFPKPRYRICQEAVERGEGLFSIRDQRSFRFFV